MKKILIAGANSYIGTSFEKYIKEHYPDDYAVDTVDVKDGTWREKSFAEYDSVFHVAGLAHQKETRGNAHLYYEINRDLAVEVAQKAKTDGVKQFIFLSSMSVYGIATGVITRQTKPNPKSHYGKSKWQAEQEMVPLASKDFKICILRPPMVYGKGCKGNFQTLVNLVKKTTIFPNVKNQRSVIYIDNLISFVKLSVDNGLSGLYFPQNRFYVCTSDMAKYIATSLNRKIYLEYLMGRIVCVLRLLFPMAKKAFGSLVYQNVEDFNFSYVIMDNEQSIIRSVE